jgi:hypothetical protein
VAADADDITNKSLPPELLRLGEAFTRVAQLVHASRPTFDRLSREVRQSETAQRLPGLAAQLGRLIEEAQQPESVKHLSGIAAQFGQLVQQKLKAAPGGSNQQTSGKKPPWRDGLDTLYLEHVAQTRKRHGYRPTWKIDTTWRISNRISRERLRELRRNHRPANAKKKGRLPSDLR